MGRWSCVVGEGDGAGVVAVKEMVQGPVSRVVGEGDGFWFVTKVGLF